jgi:hypothetical protein
MTVSGASHTTRSNGWRVFTGALLILGLSTGVARGELAIAYAVYTPAFDGRDRTPVDID